MLVRNPFTNDTRVEREARTLVDAGYPVTIIADAGAGLPRTDQRAGATVHRIARRGPDLPLLRFFAHRWRLRPRCAGRVPRSSTRTTRTPSSRLARWRRACESRSSTTRTSCGWAAPPADAPDRTTFSTASGIAGSRVGTCQRAAFVMVANPGVAPELERRYGVGGVAIVPNYPVETGEVAPRDLRDLPGAEAIPVNAAVVLYVGGIMAHRGVEELLDAVSGLPEAHLVCLGAGGGITATIEDEIRQRGLEDRVHLVRPVPSEEVVPYAASATVGVSIVQPASLSYRLALPNKLFQYMAAGIPVVASDFPDVKGVVEGSGAGVVVDPTDPRAVAAAIRRLIDDPSLARSMGAAGRRAVRERFNWDRSAQELLRGYGTIEATR